MTLDEPGSPTFGFGAIVAQAREEAGVSQQEFARRLGLTQSEISLYETGRRVPSLNKAAHLLSHLGWQLTARRVDAAGALRLGRTRDGVMHHWNPLDGPLVLLGEHRYCMEYLDLIGRAATAAGDPMPQVQWCQRRAEIDELVGRAASLILVAPAGVGRGSLRVDTLTVEVTREAIMLRRSGYCADLRWPVRKAS